MDNYQEGFESDGDFSIFGSSTPASSTPAPAVASAPAEPRALSRPAAPGRTGARPVAKAPVDSPIVTAEHVAPAEPIDEIGQFAAYAVTEPEKVPEIVSAPASSTAPDMESVLRSMAATEMPAARVAPGRPAPSTTGHESGESFAAPSGTEEIAENGETPEPEPFEEPPVDPTLIDNLIYKGIENAHDVCVAMVRSGGLPKDEVAKFWSDYSHFASSDSRRDRIADLDRRGHEILAEEARLMKQEAASGAANGGALSSLFGSMMAKRQARRQNIAKELLANNKAALDADRLRSNNEFGLKAHGRLFEVKKKLYNESMGKLFGQVDDLASSVRSYNDTFFDCPEAAEFKDEAISYSEVSGMSVPDIMKAVAEGRAPAGLLKKFAEVKDKALANSDVQAAYDRIMENESLVTKGYEGAIKDGEHMRRLNPAGFDHDNQREALTESLDLAIKDMPKPIAEGAGKEMAERLAKLAEHLQEVFSAMFERLAAAFGR